jgi:hypothetical protein
MSRTILRRYISAKVMGSSRMGASASLTASGYTVASGAGFWNVAIDSRLHSEFTTAW